jgi:hypothetical protein
MNDVKAVNDARHLADMHDGDAAKIKPHHPFGHLTDLILRFNRQDRLGHHVGGVRRLIYNMLLASPAPTRAPGSTT